MAKYWISIYLLLVSLGPALGLDLISIHGDSSLANFFYNAQTESISNAHTAVFDYRLESQLNLNKETSIFARLEGFGLYDENIANFFDDPLIDLPELYIQYDHRTTEIDQKILLGKFANRRFFSKNDINPDPFDIGERAFWGALANYSNILASIQTKQDPDQLNSIQASGSYGALYSIKGNQGQAPWGFKQSITINELNDWGASLYTISEINKTWWQTRQWDMGLVYAQDQVFKNIRGLGLSKDDSTLLYTSLSEKFNEHLSAYCRYALVLNQASNVENIVAGAYYKLDARNSFSSHIVWTDSELAPHAISHLNAFVHKISSHLYASLFNTYRYNNDNGSDNNWFIGFNLTAFF